MSRPISITNTRGVDQMASPMDSLGRSLGAIQIVDSVCGSPIRHMGARQIPHHKPDKISETPEFTLTSFAHQGGKIVGQNTYYAFGTPPSCGGCHPYLGSQWTNMESQLYAQNIQSLFQPEATMFSPPGHHFGGNPELQQSHFLQQHLSNHARSVSQPTSQHSSTSVSSIREMMTPTDDLLARYRANPNQKNLKLSDIRGHLLKFAKDQVGSRFIQQKLECCDRSEKDAIFDEVIENAPELVDDIFGNYVVQKFFEYGDQRHWARLVEAIIDRVPQYAFQMYACRVLQKALEKVNEPLQIRILDRVRNIILQCMKDQNGNHVIQKAVEKVSSPHIQFIIDKLLENPVTVHEMAIDPYGCRVVQRCLEHCSLEQIRPIIERLHFSFDDIAINQYGNYVIQHVIQHGTEDDKIIILSKIAVNLYKYSTHKYSSNVIEKCLELGTNEHKEILVKAACFQQERYPPIIVQMMKDQYANYVVQKMFEQVTSSQRRELTATIRPHIPVLRQFPHGKHILAKLDKFFHKSPAMYPF